MELDELIPRYLDAWSEPDRSRRQELLERVWAEDGTYTDPNTHVPGRRELLEYIGVILGQFPGARIVLTSAIDAHHQSVRFTWRMVLADGAVFADGLDFGELAPDGKLQRIVGFFGPLASRP
ncbi:MAG: nuclear transport factor 2 family protein [Candidatus Wallbacteria bacterium]|nr:nuclear transport factor 2 family protein [Candidatus Wallbacteria bacterium]